MDDSQSFEVWREGYSMNGATYPAIKLGAVEAKDFAEACHKICGKLSVFESLPVPRMWGLHLFDNQIEASKSHAQK
jgi:hypothetical protein